MQGKQGEMNPIRYVHVCELHTEIGRWGVISSRHVKLDLQALQQEQVEQYRCLQSRAHFLGGEGEEDQTCHPRHLLRGDLTRYRLSTLPYHPVLCVGYHSGETKQDSPKVYTTEI